MRITWFGAASLILREGSAAIAFDPFFGMPVGCFSRHGDAVIPQDALAGVSDVFVTHGHFDHIYHLPALCRAADFRIHCTPAPGKSLMRRGVPPERIVPAGGGLPVPPFTVTSYGGRHCRFDPPLILRTLFCRRFFRHPLHTARVLWAMLRFPEAGEIRMYEVTCGGQRVQILGSLGLREDVDYPTGADVLILPFQGRSDLDTYALDIVRRLAPRLVLLDHYDDAFPPLSDEIHTERFVNILSEQEHIPCRVLEKGRDYDVEA